MSIVMDFIDAAQMAAGLRRVLHIFGTVQTRVIQPKLQLNAFGTLGLFPSAMSAKPAHSKRKSQVVAMTGDCIGELEDPPNCANDIFGFMATLTEW